MACLPNSNCTATFTRQLKTINHKSANPALAPRIVISLQAVGENGSSSRLKLRK
jgi:hypothetical protein